MEWVAIIIAAIIAITLGADVKYSRSIATLMLLAVLVTIVMFIVGLHFGWIEIQIMPQQS
jgi:hypothetical protein